MGDAPKIEGYLALPCPGDIGMDEIANIKGVSPLPSDHTGDLSQLHTWFDFTRVLTSVWRPHVECTTYFFLLTTLGLQQLGTYTLLRTT